MGPQDKPEGDGAKNGWSLAGGRAVVVGFVALISALTPAAADAQGPARIPAPTAAPAQVLAPIEPRDAGFDPAGLAALNASLDARVAAGEAPGMLTLLARHGRVVQVHGVGGSGFGDVEPLRRDAIFRIYSQTKAVTGVTLLTLYDQGRFTLDDPITKFLPELAGMKVFKGLDAAGQPILEPSPRPATMRELMGHMAGFAYGLGDHDYVEKAYRDAGFLRTSKTSTQFLAAVAKLPLADAPGTRWRYSIAVDLQGIIIERLTGQSLAEAMQARVLGPLRMVDTGFYVPEAKRDRLAKLYTAASGKVEPAEGPWVLDVTRPPSFASGGGGLVSTVDDYARFVQMLLNGGQLEGARILRPETARLMHALHFTPAATAGPGGKPPLGVGTGFGLDVAVVSDPKLQGSRVGPGSFYWGGAAGTWFWIDPANDLFFLGMIQVLGRATNGAYGDISQRGVYAALTEPRR